MEFSKNLNVFRHNHRGVQEEYHGPAKLRKESVVDLREDIQMIAEYFKTKLGRTPAAVKMHTSWSHMADIHVRVENIGWKRMLEGEQDLRNWLQKAIETGVLSGEHIADAQLAAELGIDEDGDVDPLAPAKRPKKILAHKSSPTLGRSYCCLWSDVGYATRRRRRRRPLVRRQRAAGSPRGLEHTREQPASTTRPHSKVVRWP